MKRKSRFFRWDFVIPAPERTAVTIRLVPECSPRWHEPLLRHLPDLQPMFLVGQYAHRHYLGARRKSSMTETVKAFSQFGPEFFALPHPSWRAAIWMQKNPWFEKAIIPELREAVQKFI